MLREASHRRAGGGTLRLLRVVRVRVCGLAESWVGDLLMEQDSASYALRPRPSRKRNPQGDRGSPTGGDFRFSIQADVHRSRSRSRPLCVLSPSKEGERQAQREAGRHKGGTRPAQSAQADAESLTKGAIVLRFPTPRCTRGAQALVQRLPGTAQGQHRPPEIECLAPALKGTDAVPVIRDPHWRSMSTGPARLSEPGSTGVSGLVSRRTQRPLP